MLITSLNKMLKVCGCGITMMLGAAGLFGQELKIGAAAVIITPELGTPMAGYYYHRGTEGVHDDLFAKAMVLEKQGVKVALVSCDIVDVSDELVQRARTMAQEATGIPPDNITISATHSHTGPVILSTYSMYQVDGEMGEKLREYNQRLPELIAKSIIEAHQNLVPGDLFYGAGEEHSIAFNRRFFMTDGTIGWNPGKSNPKIIKPAGPIDPEVSVLYGVSNQGNPLTTFVNYALHLDITGGLEISADMPYTLSQLLAKYKGEEMVTLFGQGCSGNINHINVQQPDRQKGHAEAERIGTILAAEVIKTYTHLEAIAIDQIKVAHRTIELPLADISQVDMEQTQKIANSFGTDHAAPFMELVNAYKLLEVANRGGKPIKVEIQVIALGDQLAIVSLPGEVFVELGLYIKERSPFSNTMVVELSNNHLGYIPDRKGYLEGNYEPVSSRCAPGAGEIMVEQALELLNQLKFDD